MSTSLLAGILYVGDRTVRRLVQSGQIMAIATSRARGHILISAAALQAFLEEASLPPRTVEARQDADRDVTADGHSQEGER